MKGALAVLIARLRRIQAVVELAFLRALLALALRPSAASGTSKDKPGQSKGKPQDILVLRPDEIGDMVLALPLLRALRRRYPRARLSLLAQPLPGGLAMELGLADEIIPLAGGRAFLPVLQPAWRAWRAARGLRGLRGRGFDLLLHPRWGADFRQAGLLAALVPAARKVAFDAGDSPEQLEWNCLPATVWSARVRSGGAHEIAHLMDFMEALGLGRPRAWERRLSSPALRGQAVRRLAACGKGPWLAVAPFARSRRRVWPLEHWASLVRDLAAQRGLRPWVLAGPGEEQEAADLAQRLGPGTPVFAGLGLREVAALLSQARLFAGADSSGAQIAAAEGVPCLVLSCHPLGAPVWHANAPERFGPWGVESLVLRPATHAWPCRRGCEAFMAHCILKLDPLQARAAALDWRPGPRRPRP